MSKLSDLSDILASILKVNSKDITIDSSMDDFPEWDSVGHMNIILTIEEHFDVYIDDEDAMDLTSVKLLMHVIKKD
tara:strand:+ start:185 stop:412 length:228 start_codon:yes stop_codon:yes gene_type:complete